MGVALVVGLIQRRQKFPLGPFIALGATVSFFFGDWLITSYQQFIQSTNSNLFFVPLLVTLIALFIWLRKTRISSF